MIEGQTNTIEHCCLWNVLGSCSLDLKQSLRFPSSFDFDLSCFLPLEIDRWDDSMSFLSALTDDVTGYLRQLGVISQYTDPVPLCLERDLILNRLHRYEIFDHIDLCICPLHRYTFGIGWRMHDRCHHFEHHAPFGKQPGIKRQDASTNSLRVAPFHLAQRITGFPYGGKICHKHRKEIHHEFKPSDDSQVEDMDVDDTATESSFQSFAYRYELENNDAQQILCALAQSPIKSQSRMLLSEQTPGAVRRLTSKLRKAVAAATATLAASIAPGQGEVLIDVCSPTSHSTSSHPSLHHSWPVWPKL